MDSEELPEQSESEKSKAEESYENDIEGGREGINYLGDDKDLKEGGKKINEIWINYCGKPICFGMNEFVILTSLRCDRPKEPLIKKTPIKNSKVKDYPDEVSHPRILRWLAAKSNTGIKEVDLFNPPNDAVVHPWIAANEQELEMTSFITLGLIDMIVDLTVELIKNELAGATTIRRAVRQGQPHVEALNDQPAATDLGDASGGVSGGVVDVGGIYADADAVAIHDDEHVDTQEKINMFEITPYSGPSHPSSLSCSHCKCKGCMDKQDKLFQKIDALTNVVEELKSKKGVIPFKKCDRIMKLNFYNYFKNRYDDLIQLASNPGGSRFDSLVSRFEWDEDMIEYVRGKRPYPHNKDWINAKRIFAIMNVNVKYFLALEILPENRMMKVYHCNLPVFKEVDFLNKMQPLLDLFPSLLKQSKLMNHLPLKVLNEK
ncbi:hypothetical protein FXO37_34027 [Capsicum annuum]|nr:hypothetical protein FXO37_34027 [Capsicum annuum]